jgi:hypothetical protein
MFDHRLRKIWILLWLVVATAAPASAADGPGAGFELNREATTFKSPDRKVLIEQYVKKSEGMHRDPKDPYALDHAFAGLVKGMDENYAWMDEHWSDSRYVVISLSFDMQGEDEAGRWIEGWHRVYDLKMGAFSVPADFAENNANAIKKPEPKKPEPKNPEPKNPEPK